MITTCSLVLFVNLACIYLMYKNGKTTRPSSIAVLNLLCCHVTQGVLVIPSYILKRSSLSNEEAAICDTFRFSYMIANYAVCLSLLIITVDRTLAIKKPLLYRSTMTNRKMIYANLSSWIYTVLLCTIPFVPDPNSYNKCNYNPQREWTLVMLTCNTMLPFIVIVCCYLIIFNSVRSSRIFRLKSQMENSNGSSSGPKGSELRIAKISLLIVSAYVLCWGPSFVYYFLLATCQSCFRESYLSSKVEPMVTFAMKYLTFLNGIINPVIYCFAHKSLKNGFKSKRKRHAVRQRAFTGEVSLRAVEVSNREFTVSQVTLEDSI